MDVPKGARLQDECPKCGEKSWKYLYNNNNTSYQVRVQCLQTDCKHKYQRYAFRKSHPHGYKKVKVTEPEQYVGLVKVCPDCGRSDVKFYGLNNNDVIQARYKCLNPVCKKLFTPFGTSRRNQQNQQEMTTTDMQVADDIVEYFERSMFNDYSQYSTSNDHSPMTDVVDPMGFMPCAYYNDTIQDYFGEEESLERLTSWIYPHHESRNVMLPTGNLQEDDRVNALPSPTTCNLKLKDPVTHWVHNLPTPTNLLQEVDRLVHNVSTTPTSLQEEDHMPTWETILQEDRDMVWQTVLT